MTNGVKVTQKQIEGCRRERRKQNVEAGRWVPQRFNASWKMTWKDLWPFVLAFGISIILTLLIP